jgi:hypothetical protein
MGPDGRTALTTVDRDDPNAEIREDLGTFTRLERAPAWTTHLGRVLITGKKAGYQRD